MSKCSATSAFLPTPIRPEGGGKNRKPSILTAIATALIVFATPASAAKIDDQFQAWLAKDLWPEAKAKGISKATFDAAFSGVSPNLKLPDLVLPGEKPKTPKTQHQAEFGSPGNYFAEKTLGAVTAGGRTRAGANARTLAAIEKRFGVPAGVVLAIWGRESGFGAAKMPHDAFEVLGTKAFLATRKEMFRKELLAGLEMVERGLVSRKAMRSSWAGALGQPQFLPTSFLKGQEDRRLDGYGHHSRRRQAIPAKRGPRRRFPDDAGGAQRSGLHRHAQLLRAQGL
jgi:membrane-bound lytic murein transglycosylase B